MTEKIFTEEQYRAIVKAGNKKMTDTWGVIDYEQKTTDLLKRYAKNHDAEWYPSFMKFNQQIMAIMNPLTREWAHDKFVEKEKRYIFSTKKKNDANDSLRLRNNICNAIVLDDCTGTPLTESEIREWGYNPNMFDKEEVE